MASNNEITEKAQEVVVKALEATKEAIEKSEPERAISFAQIATHMEYMARPSQPEFPFGLPVEITATGGEDA